MQDRFGAKNPKSLQLRFHTQTGGSTLTAQQPDNNIVRVTLQALAAVLGGTQSLHTNSRDEALSLPTETSAQIALRTQQIIAYESGVADTIDPLGGSFFVETLTDDVERLAMAYIHRIDAMGGAVEAIEQGFMQREIHATAYQTQQAIERGDEIVVGVNKYRLEGEVEPELLQMDPTIEETARQRLAAWRTVRSDTDCQMTLQALRIGAEGDANLMPLIVQAVRAHATTGEICDVMRAVFGEYRPQVF